MFCPRRIPTTGGMSWANSPPCRGEHARNGHVLQDIGLCPQHTSWNPTWRDMAQDVSWRRSCRVVLQRTLCSTTYIFFLALGGHTFCPQDIPWGCFRTGGVGVSWTTSWSTYVLGNMSYRYIVQNTRYVLGTGWTYVVCIRAEHTSWKIPKYVLGHIEPTSLTYNVYIRRRDTSLKKGSLEVRFEDVYQRRMHRVYLKDVSLLCRQYTSLVYVLDYILSSGLQGRILRT